jgi:hypothetical protein
LPERFNKYFKNILFILLAVYAGCGLFDTRNPEDPVTIRSTYEPPTTPEAVLRNLSSSIIEKNSSNYQKCLSPIQYSYVPDAKSQSLYGTIFQNWDMNSEKFYYENLIAQTNAEASSNLFLSNAVTNQITPDSAIYTADYIVVFQHNKTNVPKSSVGNVRLSLKADESNFFYILYWEDFRKLDTDFTWSELKANFSN